MLNDYPTYTVKVIVETQFQVSETHTSRIEYIEAMMNFTTEIDAVKAAIDSLRHRYYELEQDEV